MPPALGGGARLGRTSPPTGRPGAGGTRSEFSGPDGLVSNEYAHSHPRAPEAVTSPVWDVTSGSLFQQEGAGWTGKPDDATPGPASATGTGSAVFRVITRRSDYSNVAVSFALRMDGLTATPRTPAVPLDGVNVFLRYQSEEFLYVVAVGRRDNTIVVKKKAPGGHSNGGTYYTLGNAVYHDIGLGRWQQVRASIRTLADSSVSIDLSLDGYQLLHVVDAGTGGPPITHPGSVGIRGDNCDFRFRHFSVGAP
ncbi:MAG: hypothetical protein NVSMB32_10960 [Actinomycetota bacterium]